MGIRPLATVLVLVALVAGASTAFAAHRPAAVRSTNTIVSQGTGHEVLEGAGLTYGSLQPGGVIRFIDLSPRHDAKITVTAQVPASGGVAAQNIGVKSLRQGGMLVYRILRPNRQNARAVLAFSVAGSRFRLALDGTSVLNGAAVIGKVSLEGAGTIAVNGQAPPVEWATAVRVILTAHPVVPAKPVPTTVTTTTTTTTISTTTTP
jgi:hypothetical protein